MVKNYIVPPILIEIIYLLKYADISIEYF